MFLFARHASRRSKKLKGLATSSNTAVQVNVCEQVLLYRETGTQPKSIIFFTTPTQNTSAKSGCTKKLHGLQNVIFKGVFGCAPAHLVYLDILSK